MYYDVIINELYCRLKDGLVKVYLRGRVLCLVCGVRPWVSCEHQKEIESR